MISPPGWTACRRICLRPGEEVHAPLCLRPGWTRCALRVLLEDWQPADRVFLRPCGGCGCSVRTLLATGEALFVSLAPGSYLLILERGRCRTCLAAELPPGVNLTVGWCLARNQGWKRQDRFHAWFNRP